MLFAAFSTLAMMAAPIDYIGVMNVNSASGSLTQPNTKVIVEQKGTAIYTVTVTNYTIVLMGETHYVGPVTFYDMVGTVDDEGYVTVSGSTKMNLEDLIDMDELDDLFGGGMFGDITSMITQQQYPVNMNARFNYRYINLTMDTRVTVTMNLYGMFEQELLNENVRNTFNGESNEEPPVVYERGDVNGDGVVDVEDINALINVVLENVPIDYYGDRSNLTSGDEIIDIVDINELISILLNQ